MWNSSSKIFQVIKEDNGLVVNYEATSVVWIDPNYQEMENKNFVVNKDVDMELDDGEV